MNRMQAIAMKVMLRSLYDGPSSVGELCAATGMSQSTIRLYLDQLRKGNLVRIVGYDRAGNNCPCIRLYQFDPDKPNVQVPKMTIAQRSRNSRQRRKTRELHARIGGQI